MLINSEYSLSGCTCAYTDFFLLLQISPMQQLKFYSHKKYIMSTLQLSVVLDSFNDTNDKTLQSALNDIWPVG